jgi:hypothetical protein
MANGYHYLSNKNIEAQTADCAVCGPVRIWLQVKGGGRKQWRCVEWRRAYARKRMQTPKMKQYMASYQAKWQAANKGRVATYGRRSLLKAHGLTEADYEKMVADRKGKCDLCDEVPDKLFIDHDHDSLKIRGLLCMRCNLALGFLKDNPEVAARIPRYLGLLERQS